MSSYKQKKLLSLIVASLLPSVLVCSCASSNLSDKEKEFEAKKAEWETQSAQKGTVVYAIRDIPEGETIKADQLEEKEIEVNKIPLDALTSTARCSGRAKYGISMGQIIKQHDLAAEGRLAKALAMPLSEAARKKLEDLAKAKKITASELAKQLLEEKLNSIK